MLFHLGYAKKYTELLFWRSNERLTMADDIPRAAHNAAPPPQPHRLPRRLLLLLYTSATKAHSLLIKSSVKGRPGPWQVHCESGGSGVGGWWLRAAVFVRREWERGERSTRRWKELTRTPSLSDVVWESCKTVGRTAPPLSEQSREGYVAVWASFAFELNDSWFWLRNPNDSHFWLS